ncbi:MAG: 50S ribosomal protein L31e [Candidatus Woesearchaeota archaeon]
MADTKNTAKTLEREYVIPLRRKFLLVPKYRRAEKSVTAIREFMTKHMKGNEVRIGRHLNMELWKHGARNPPHHVTVIAKRNDEGIVDVELKGAPAEKKTEAPEETKKKVSESEAPVKDAEIVEETKKADTPKAKEFVKADDKKDEKVPAKKEEKTETVKEEKAPAKVDSEKKAETLPKKSDAKPAESASKPASDKKEASAEQKK